MCNKSMNIDFWKDIKNSKRNLIFFSLQNSPTVSKALEQFVKAEQLDGENAYKCTK